MELLQGNTMKVYALLLTRESMRMRDIQRKLKFSSPSLAIHHLQKLMDASLVVKDAHGDYSVKKDVRVGSLTLFVRIGTHFLPRFVFQAALLTSILIPYLIFFMTIPPQKELKMVTFLKNCSTTCVGPLRLYYRHFGVQSC